MSSTTSVRCCDTPRQKITITKKPNHPCCGARHVTPRPNPKEGHDFREIVYSKYIFLPTRRNAPNLL